MGGIKSWMYFPGHSLPMVLGLLSAKSEGGQLGVGGGGESILPSSGSFCPNGNGRWGVGDGWEGWVYWIPSPPQGPLFLICTKAWSEPGSLLCLILSFLLWSSTFQCLVVVGTWVYTGTGLIMVGNDPSPTSLLKTQLLLSWLEWSRCGTAPFRARDEMVTHRGTFPRSNSMNSVCFRACESFSLLSDLHQRGWGGGVGAEITKNAGSQWVKFFGKETSWLSLTWGRSRLCKNIAV